MAFNEATAARVRQVLAKSKVVEKKMFGGLAFLLDGRLCCGVLGDDLVVRVPADEIEVALKAPHARPMDFTGRPMNGFVYIGPKGCAKDGDLKRWVETGLVFARTAPVKKRKMRRTK